MLATKTSFFIFSSKLVKNKNKGRGRSRYEEGGREGKQAQQAQQQQQPW